MNLPRTNSRTPELPGWARWRDEELVLMLHVQPGAKRSAVCGEHGGRLKIALQAPPVDGKANAELLRFLADALGLRRASLRVASGLASREKSIAISCAQAQAPDLAGRLDPATP